MDLEAVLGRSWGLLVRSWGLLARSWAVLDGQEGQKAADQGAWRTQGQTVSAPTLGKGHFPPPPLASTLSLPGPEEEENETMELSTTGKTEDSGPQGRGKSPLEGRGMMV